MVSARHTNCGGVAEAPLPTTLLVGCQHSVLPDAGLACDCLALHSFIIQGNSTNRACRLPAENWLGLLCVYHGALHPYTS